MGNDVANEIVLPIPGCSLVESRVLRQVIVWADEYLRRKERGERYAEPPTTERCSKHFRIPHDRMLALLNRLERFGLVRKDRRMSAGLSGYGYDGALYSSVLPTPKARELAAKSVLRT